MARIVISEFMDAPAVETLRTGNDVVLDETLCDRPGDLASLVAEADALIVRNRTMVTSAIVNAAPKLKAVGRLGVGLDNIDLEACKTNGVAVLPAVGANAASVAEYVLTSAMLLLRGPVFFSTHRLQEGTWPRGELSNGREIAGKTLGLIGFGSIGQVTANLARAAGFKTAAFDEFLPADHHGWKTTRRCASIADLLQQSDVVSLHCPLTPETQGLIAAPEIAAMKKHAILINTARGGIVDEQALAGALRSGHLGGAAIDVFAAEPIDAAASSLFAGLSNVILTPHVAGVTHESNERISAITAQNVLRVLKERSQ